MMKKEIEVMVIHTVREVIGPIVEGLIRKVVKEEIQSAQEKFLTGGKCLENETAVSKERSLCLKFLDEVSLPVLTGKLIKGKGGTPIRVALFDNITKQVVDPGPELTSKVEILVLEANDDDNEDNWSREDFNNRIIREGDKKKPHFAKSNYISLKEGIGTLCSTKLGHDSTWMKSCKCRLGARMEGLGGVRVQEAWTESFMVSDSRSELYKNHYPPSLSDPVWRLENIGKDGSPCKRLNKKQISTVQDFLFLHYVNPQALRQIVRAGDKMWKTTLDHAQTCIIDDKRMYLYYPLSEPRTGVVFDVVGRLKGAIHDSHYVPNDNLSETEQDCARNLLLSAFENRNEIIPFNDEHSLLQQFSNRSSYLNTDLHGCDLSFLERINWCDPTEAGDLSQIVQPAIRPSVHPNNFCNLEAFALASMGQSYVPSFGVPNQSPSHLLSDTNSLSEYFIGDEFISPISPETNNFADTLRAESHSPGQSNACRTHLVGAASLIMLWMVRARKRFMALGGIHVQKRQRT